MKKGYIIVLGLILIVIFFSAVFFSFFAGEDTEIDHMKSNGTLLPEPLKESDFSVEEALSSRRSIRHYSGRALTLAEISQILWAAQGITGIGGLRTAPSAGALYPLEIYLVAGDVSGLSPGVYHYIPTDHSLELHIHGDIRRELCSSALDQQAVRDAPAVIVIAAQPSRTTQKYGERGTRYVWLEAGHASQNICLQAVSLGLGTVPIGAFSDEKIIKLLELEEGQNPLYLMPIGGVLLIEGSL